MRAYLLRRLLLAIPTLLGVTFITFAVLHLAPGDPTTLSAGELGHGSDTPAAIAHLRQEMGLDRPLPEQYVHWLSRLARLDLGTSWNTGRSVASQIAERLPRTAFLALASLLLVCLVAIPLGVESAVRRGTKVERATTAGLFLVYSAPSFWVGTLALVLLGGGRYLDLIPVQGLTSEGWASMGPAAKLADLFWHAAAPVLVLSYALLAGTSRYVRAAVLEVIGQDHVRTARAKGLPEHSVNYRHALRSALVPVLSQLGVVLPALLGGSVIVERIFGVPGMGDLMFEAILARDYQLILGVMTVSALLTMALVLVTDLLYALVDPRIATAFK